MADLLCEGVVVGTITQSGSGGAFITLTDAAGAPLKQLRFQTFTDWTDTYIDGGGTTDSTPDIISGGLPNATVGVPYSYEFSAVGGTAPYVYSLSGESNLGPGAGLTLNSNGTITGTPTTAGVKVFTVRVTDADDATGDLDCALVTVDPPLLVVPVVAALPELTTGQAVSITLGAAIWGANTLDTIAVDPGGDALPTGLTLSQSEIGNVWSIAGTPTVAVDATVVLIATDSNDNTGTASIEIVVVEP